MSIRTWLWLGTVLNAMVFLPAAYMAFNAVGFAIAYPESGAITAVAFLFAVLPVFGLLAPFAAWRIHAKRSDDRNAVLIVAAPLVYAAFLVAFLLNN